MDIIGIFPKQMATILGWKSFAKERSRHIGPARTCIPREKSSAPFEKVPGPPGALKEGDGLKAPWTSWLPHGNFPGSSRNHVSVVGLGWQGRVKPPLSLILNN